jgi:hypothetical protein
MTREHIVSKATRLGYTQVIISPARDGNQLRACLRFDGPKGAYQSYINRELLQPAIISQLDEGRQVKITVGNEMEISHQRASRDDTPQQLAPDFDRCKLCAKHIRHSQWRHEDELEKWYDKVEASYTMNQVMAMV